MTHGLYHCGKGTRTSWRHDSRVFSHDVHIFYALQKDWLQLMATGFLTVFKYFQNEATATNGPVAFSPVQFGCGHFFGCINRTFKHYVVLSLAVAVLMLWRPECVHVAGGGCASVAAPWMCVSPAVCVSPVVCVYVVSVIVRGARLTEDQKQVAAFDGYPPYQTCQDITPGSHNMDLLTDALHSRLLHQQWEYEDSQLERY
jgi:hypothetical protein